MTILWTHRSLLDLEEIVEFFSLIASNEIGFKVVGSIHQKVDILKSQPKLGKIETFGKTVFLEYRALIEGNYKVIYRIDEPNDTILIARVFDTRRDPKKKTP